MSGEATRGGGLKQVNVLVITTDKPFTAPACKMSLVKDARKRLQTVYFPVLCSSSTFNARRFDEDSVARQCETEGEKKLKGFKFRF